MSDLNVYSTTAAVNALTPVDGDMVVDTEANAVKVYCNSAWKVFNNDYAEIYENRWAMDAGKLEIASTSDFAFGTAGFTISLWFIHDNSSMALLDFRGAGTPGDVKAPMVWLDSGSGGINYHANSTYRIFGSYTYQANTWRHLVIHNDGSGTTSMYLDNLTTPLGSFSDTINYAQNDITIGSYYAGTGANTIDEFSVFNSTSSLTSVAALASGGKPANLSSYDPVAWIRMGDDSNDSPVAAGNITGITDSSGNGNDATQSTASNQPTFSALASSETIYV
jgi:hypothetical protein